MNAYRDRILGLLGADSPYEVLETTPGRVAALIERLGDEGLGRRFGPGKWTGREVVAHMADVEIGTGFRIRQMVTEPDHVIQPYDQDAWARLYPALDARLAARAFAALRAWNLASSAARRVSGCSSACKRGTIAITWRSSSGSPGTRSRIEDPPESGLMSRAGEHPSA